MRNLDATDGRGDGGGAPAEAEHPLRLLVDGAHEHAIFLVDAAGAVRTWSAAAERLLGWSGEEISGRPVATLLDPADAAAGQAGTALALAAERGGHTEEGWRVRKDGTRFWAEVTVSPVRDAAGALAGFTLVVRDEDERRAAEEARRRLAVSREAARGRDEFLAIVSHEFRTPLTTLQLELQGALRALVAGAQVTEADRERLARLQRHVTRLDELVAGLVRVGRLASGELRLERAEVDLAPLVRELVERWRPIAARHRSELDARIDGALPGSFDRERIAEAISAVLANAVKYGAGRPVRVRASRGEGCAAVEIEDEGPGIAEEDQARVFERFERAVPSSNYGGFGVGLWIARQIAVAHGGDVEVRSAPGRGSCFTLRLPFGS